MQPFLVAPGSYARPHSLETSADGAARRAMARLRRTALWPAQAALLLLALQACGYDDPGDGSRTVRLQASLDCAHPELVTQANFLLWKASEPLSEAQVVLIDADTHERLELPEGASAGAYSASWPGYHRRVQVHVWQGQDGMTFQLEGPSQHTLVSPVPGTVVPVGKALKVRWHAPDGVRADEAEVALEGSRISRRVGRDGGKARLTAREIGAGAQVLTVRRKRQMVPGGAAEGSQIVSSYAVSVPLVRSTPVEHH